jgi:hypothetical protein
LIALLTLRGLRLPNLSAKRPFSPHRSRRPKNNLIEHHIAARDLETTLQQARAFIRDQTKR